MKKVFWACFLICLLVLTVEQSSAQVYVDLSSASCRVIDGRVIVEHIGYQGYIFWLSTQWNPYTLSFNIPNNPQYGTDFGIESLPGAGGGQRSCSFLFTDSRTGGQANVSITALPASGSLRIAVSLYGTDVYLCFTGVHVQVTDANFMSFYHTDSTAGTNWGGCGHLIPGNTYDGLILKQFVPIPPSSGQINLSQPFTFYYNDDYSGQVYSAYCN